MAVLRLNGETGFRVEDVRDWLGRIDHAYNSLYAFEALVNVTQPGRFVTPPGGPTSGLIYGWWVHPSPARTRLLISWPPTAETVAPVVPPRHRLILHAARLESPGSWEFVGALNPLEVLRQYLNDRHERRKDKDYRNENEKRRQELENSLLENKVVKERIEMAKSIGVTDQDLTPLLNELVYKPLRRLDGPQDRGAIETAEVVDDTNPFHINPHPTR